MSTCLDCAIYLERVRELEGQRDNAVKSCNELADRMGRAEREREEAREALERIVVLDKHNNVQFQMAQIARTALAGEAEPADDTSGVCRQRKHRQCSGIECLCRCHVAERNPPAPQHDKDCAACIMGTHPVLSEEERNG